MANRNKSLAGGYYGVPIPLPSEVSILDIAHKLSNTCRFAGGTCTFFSTAQHSLEVGHLAASVAHKFGVSPAKAELAGLLHDAPEYVYGDIIGPVKCKLDQDSPSWRHICAAADMAVFAGLGVSHIMEECETVVAWADEEMLISDAARWAVLGPIDIRGCEIVIEEQGVVPPPYKLRFSKQSAWGPGEAVAPFVNRYRLLMHSLGLTELRP